MPCFCLPHADTSYFAHFSSLLWCPQARWPSSWGDWGFLPSKGCQPFFPGRKITKNINNPPHLSARNVLKIRQYIKQNKCLQKVWKPMSFHSHKGTIFMVSRALKGSAKYWAWGCLTLQRTGVLHGVKVGLQLVESRNSLFLLWIAGEQKSVGLGGVFFVRALTIIFSS